MNTSPDGFPTEEHKRLDQTGRREADWRRWGPYLSERQWGTVREDYSESGDAWAYFPHEHARSRVYRWGEDGLLGLSDRKGRLCFSLALWNGQDPYLKERLFGLSGPQGNHGEDLKELYYYLDGTPTNSYLKALYQYPQAAFPYNELIKENKRRSRLDPEYELLETGVFEEDRFFDVFVEYAKGDPEDLYIRITAVNRGPEPAHLSLVPTLWFRNTWGWGRSGEGFTAKPEMKAVAPNKLEASHETLGRFFFEAAKVEGLEGPVLLFTENESNNESLFHIPNAAPYVKDGFHDFVVSGHEEAVNPDQEGTRAAVLYRGTIPAGEEVTLRLRLWAADDIGQGTEGFEVSDEAIDDLFLKRIKEADAFYAEVIPEQVAEDDRTIMRQGYAGLIWSRQFYYFNVQQWLEGDPSFPPPPAGRAAIRNRRWRHLYNHDVISMPDKWEYPWYAAWDLAFHMVPFSRIDPAFAKDQLLLFLREWYMHPNGQLPAYEWSFSDTNPPVHAWAALKVYRGLDKEGQADRAFLARIFQKLLINFTWWVNQKDSNENDVFQGGFLGLDNIGVFDRSRPLPTGGTLEQADATAWMAFYCITMLDIALELAREDPVFEDVASKFLMHFVRIAEAIHDVDGTGLWDEEDGFYYDHVHVGEHFLPLRLRSLVGLIPIVAVGVIDQPLIDRLPGFKKRMEWFLREDKDLARRIAYLERREEGEVHRHRLLALLSKDRLIRILGYLLDEDEFLSPFGIRSLSRYHESTPYHFVVGRETYEVKYQPGESDNAIFGGNSNWRGPIWLPINYLIIQALRRYHDFYGDSLTVECPTGSGQRMTLEAVAGYLTERLLRLFRRNDLGRRPLHGDEKRFEVGAEGQDHVLFYEYFHAETGLGLGAAHQTGWTALVNTLLDEYNAALANSD